jgi:cobalt-zinc-cadmium efflux system membrane fusion protein
MFRYPNAPAAILLALLVHAGCAQPTDRGDEDESLIKPNRDSQVAVIDTQRLGITTTPVVLQEILETKSAIGWLEAPEQSIQIIRAPMNGFVNPPPNNPLPELGESVSEKQIIASIELFLTPQELSQMAILRKDIETQLQQARITIELSESQLNQVISAREAISGVRVNQLKESLAHAQTAYQVAQDKLNYLSKNLSTEDPSAIHHFIEASKGGRITHLHVVPGQFVLAGDPLITLEDWSTLWLRVPLFEHDTPKIDPLASALVQDAQLNYSKSATPLTLPKPTRSMTRTLDRYYKIDNADWSLSVGQSLPVKLSLGNPRIAAMIPKSALLFNTFGQSSCFTISKDKTSFSRHAIELGSPDGELIEVTKGINHSDLVVSILSLIHI